MHKMEFSAVYQIGKLSSYHATVIITVNDSTQQFMKLIKNYTENVEK